MVESTLSFIGAAPLAQSNPQALIDVVFVHGLGGGPIATWQHDGHPENFWPKWLAEDLGTVINVYSAGYNSGIFAGALAGEGPSIIDHSTTLLDFLVSKGLGQRKLVFVTHSLGGLIAKQMLRRCSDAANPTRKKLLDAVSGIVFIGTPHFGAGGATLLKTMLQALASKNVQQLAFGEEQLIDLGEWFRNWASMKGLPVAAYYETRKLGTMIVGKVSANPYVTGCEPTAIDADHISMAKPTSRQSQLYLSVRHFIQQLFPPAGKADLGGADTPVNTPGSGGGQGPLSQGGQTETCSVLLGEYEYFQTISPDDRRPLVH